MLTWISQNPGVAVALVGVVVALVSLVSGVIGAKIGEGIERRKEERADRRRQADERRALIAEWRKLVADVSTYAQVTGTRDVYDYLLGQAAFHSLEAHAGVTFRGGIQVYPALQIGHHLARPLQELLHTIDELERRWGLRDPKGLYDSDGK